VAACGLAGVSCRLFFYFPDFMRVISQSEIKNV